MESNSYIYSNGSVYKDGPVITVQKNEVLVTFTEEILDEKLHFLCSE